MNHPSIAYKKSWLASQMIPKPLFYAASYAGLALRGEQERLRQQALLQYGHQYGLHPDKTEPSPYAPFAAGAYSRTPVAGWQIDSALSNIDRTVYFHPHSGKAIVAFSGTRPTQRGAAFRDLSTDALLALGLKDTSHRFKNMEKVTSQAISKYGPSNVHLTGHSLGGSVAMEMSRKHHLPATVFSPHLPWNEIESVDYPLVHVHMNFTDPVSAFVPLGSIGKTTVHFRGAFQHGL